jgi:TolB-like protein
MIKYRHIVFTLLVFAMGSVLFLTGCVSEYNREKIEKARTVAEIQRINNRAELADADHEVRMIAAEIVSEIQKRLKETNIQLTKDADIMNTNYKAADSLIRKLSVKLDKDNPVLVASFVNLDNLDESSTFGRVVSEQIGSRLNQKGYSTIELKLRTNIFIKEGSGEFLLSREMAEISTKHRAQAVVVGSYAVASSRVYLTARIINVRNGGVLASYDYNIPIGRNTFKMLLKGKDSPDWL